MKKTKFFYIIIGLLTLINAAKADLNVSLKKYLDGVDLENGSTQIYLLERCSAVYAYASGIVLKSDAVSSKNFIEISSFIVTRSL